MKEQLLIELKEEYKECKLCHDLAKSRKKIVFGDGNPDAEIMIVGVQPSIYGGDVSGKPLLTSKSGKFLKALFEKNGLKYEDTYRTNLLCCASENNKIPKEHQIKLCSVRLNKEIEIIQPKIILCLGNYPLKYFKPKANGMSTELNKPFRYKKSIVIPIYHPSFILRGNFVDDSFFNNTFKLIKNLKGGKKLKMAERKRQYGKDVEDRVVSLAKQGKSPKEISKEFNGHPAVPKIKRILKAANVAIDKVAKKEPAKKSTPSK